VSDLLVDDVWMYSLGLFVVDLMIAIPKGDDADARLEFAPDDLDSVPGMLRVLLDRASLTYMSLVSQFHAELVAAYKESNAYQSVYLY